jgi:hypothetical protein
MMPRSIRETQASDQARVEALSYVTNNFSQRGHAEDFGVLEVVVPRSDSNSGLEPHSCPFLSVYV